MNERKARKQYINIYILIVLLTFNLTFLQNKNELINRKDLIFKSNELKTLDQEGENYRLVTSADNVQVPVPKGYVASGATGENYVTPEYSHTTITNKISTTPTQLNWSSPEGEQYPWTQDENGIWISGNQGIPNSESVLESEEFDYIKGTTLTINYTYSCQSSYNTDYFQIHLLNVTNNVRQVIVNNYGNENTSFDYITSNYAYTKNDLATGRYKIRAIYRKNDSIDRGQDSSYIKLSTYFKEDENGQTIEVDQKTKIHDGGFVIYQLTDAELETDPNGTSVNINDTNKDIAQSERNQYVWVPVSNIEDIVRTKTENNGTMQFGQEYKFSNTSITKETNTGTDYFREPGLVKNNDKTKFYLQRYSNLDKRENYLNEQQKDFTIMIKSINKYKGFYIGRYETGDDYEHRSSKGCFINPRIVRYNNNNNINFVTWYDSYKDLKRLSGKTEKYVETGMLYDSLWDYTLKWLNETDTRNYEDINKDSGTWGNYMNNSLKYKSSANGAEGTKNTHSYFRTPTGGITEITYNGETYSDSPTASNNIFDLAGNVNEWTRSRNGTYDRRNRGGTCDINSNGYPARYKNYNSPYYSYYVIGVRGQLYIL